MLNREQMLSNLSEFMGQKCGTENTELGPEAVS